MCPCPGSDGHDFPWPLDELVPRFGAQGDDFFVGIENPVGQPVVSHELPYVFDRVQLGCPWGQRQKCDVGRDHELSGGMPSGPIEDEDGVGPRCYLGRDFIEMPLHGLGVAARQHQGRADAAFRTDGTEDIGRFCALILGCHRAAAARCPAPREHGFLTDPSLVLPPNFYGAAGGKFGADFCQLGGEVFLKSSTANSFCPR